jgi:hypothetical protein
METGIVMEYFFADRANGDRDTCETLEKALAAAATCIGFYRREAIADTEWMDEVEGVVVGTAIPGTRDGDVVTHRATAFGNDEEGYDYRMEAAAPVLAPQIGSRAMRP